MRKTLAIAIAAAIGSSIAFPAAAEDAATLQDAIKNGKIDMNFRYRYENVDEDNAKDEAHASTLKSRLTFTTQSFMNLQAQVEVDNASDIGNKNFCDTQNGLCAAGPSQHSVVADPDYTSVNQAWISYSGLFDTTLKHGRQRVNLDNQRFIGGVAWRQNEQTFDATSLTNKSLPDTTIFLAYVTGIETILDTDINKDAQMYNINYSGLSFASVSVYNYDLEEVDGTNTTGIRLSGAPEIVGLKINYEVEYAKQDKENTGSSDNDAKYTHVALGTALGPVKVKLGQEVLGSDDGAYGFQTVLATKHKFNGFADVFLGTPTSGLDDKYLTLAGKCPITGANISVTYHDFDADDGNMDFGSEIDLVVSKKVLENTTLLLKYADYDRGDSTSGKVDTQKLWLQAQVNF